MSYRMDQTDKIVSVALVLAALVVCFFAFAIIIEAKHGVELISECIADPKYDKFQCRAMIYGGGS